MSYQIVKTEMADIQIRDIINYIADDSGSAETALDYLDRLEHAINILSQLPYDVSEARHMALKRKGFRVLVVERHLIFYKVKEDKTVVIHAVVDFRRDYVNLVL